MDNNTQLIKVPFAKDPVNLGYYDDLVAQEPLRARNIKYVHIEGPDRRGVDCAMLYNPALFTLTDAVLHPYVQELEQDSAFYTRGFLTVNGKLAGEDISVIVTETTLFPALYPRVRFS